VPYLVNFTVMKRYVSGTYPTPKACASLVAYKDTLILFGGWSHPTPYPLHQVSKQTQLWQWVENAAQCRLYTSWML